MSQHALLSLVTFVLIRLASSQSATSSSLEPLASKHFTWPDIPYQVTGDQGGERGPQAGYNLCNSTTENQQSMCQTAFLNNLGDFCMWSSAQTDDTIGESEAREVAWCTSPGHGTRVIPPGAITGAQWLYAKNYLQVVGFIDQTKVGLQASDQGGELDPHGADEQGNPLGGIVFTNGFGMTSSSFQDLAKSGNFTNNQTYVQVIEWIDFIGSGQFCLKMCNPNDANAAELCQHIYDEVGCSYNALADYGHINGTFEVCDSDDMTPPGVYTANGALTTWFQPQDGSPVSPPYTTSIPASSNCVTYSSEQIFAAAATDTAVGGSSAAASVTGSGSGSSSSSTDQSDASAGIPVVDTSAAPFLVTGFFAFIATMTFILL
ncbi:macrofage activating [Pyrrhoderma noxium]|uniref:Macrofage activating n=1 Tax=Pyrrhoderma noxium TaxID=2282107 RepID=A0A286U9B6_9AGAM|nr:macrofage activating [Pyrrhoderma noxium]